MSIEKIQPLSTLLSPEIEDSLPELKRQVIALAKVLSSEVSQPV